MMRKKLILILIIVGFLVYFNSLFNGFVWDDEEQIVNNTAVHSIANISQFFKGGTFNDGGTGRFTGIYYKPMMTVFFSLVYSLFGSRPFFFHILQLFIHITNVILVFHLFLRFFDKKKSFFLALIFLTHPINTEAVVYISALQDVLCFFFGILALLIVTKNSISLKRLVVASGLLFLSLISKETGIVFFVLVAGYFFIIKKEFDTNLILGAILIFALYFLMRVGVAGVGFAKFGISPISRANLFVRLITVPQVIFYYIKTFFYPKNLAVLQHWLVTKPTTLEFFLPLLFDIGFFATIGIYCFVNKKKEALFFFLWLVVGLGLHLNIFPLDMTVAERWFYTPIIGVLGIFGILLNKSGVANRGLQIIFVVIIVLLSVRTIRRNFDWKNGLTLFSRDIKIAKNSFDLENNLGVELFRIGKIEEAKKHFEKSTELAPYWWTNWNNLGVCYEKEKNLIRAQFLYKKAIDNGEYYLAYENYTLILIKQKKEKQAKRFLENQALIKFPQNLTLRNIYYFHWRS